jgi:hypothetical protein
MRLHVCQGQLRWAVGLVVSYTHTHTPPTAHNAFPFGVTPVRGKAWWVVSGRRLRRYAAVCVCVLFSVARSCFGVCSVLASLMSTVLQLRTLLEQRFPDALPVTYRTTNAVATGIARLDQMLPSGGLPRGRLAVWTPGGGATALLQAAARAAVGRGERSAWIDAARRVTADSWRAGPLLVRPANELDALVCAEELLRSGGFALVVLAGADAGVSREVTRLSRAAKEGGAALVAMTRQATVANLRIQSRIAPDGYRWRRGPFGEVVDVESVVVHIEAAAMGWSARTELELPVLVHSPRASLSPGLVDRRGVVSQKALSRNEVVEKS